MNFDLTDEQRLLQETVAKLAADDANLRQGKADAAPDEFRRSRWHQFAEVGLLGLPFPEVNGGLGGNAVDVMIVMETLGRALVPEPYVEMVVLSGSLLCLAGSETQQGSLLPKLATGDLLLAFAHFEPQARYNLAHVTTSARRDGSSYVLDGRKSAVTCGESADKLIVSARTAGGETEPSGITLFLLDRNQPGVSLRGCSTVDGRRAAEVELADVRVEGEALLGVADAALPLIQHAVDRAIAATCAEAVGIMDRLNQITLEYLKTRHQFGVPIGSFQVLQHRMVDMVIEHEEAKSLAFLAALAIDFAVPAARRQAISAAKARIGGAGRFVGEQSIQLHGAIGMTDEYIVGRYFKRLLMIDRSFGDVDYHLSAFADRSLART